MTTILSCPFVSSIKRKIDLLIALSVFLMFSPDAESQKKASYKVDGREFLVQHVNAEIEAILSHAAVPGLSLALIYNDSVVFSRNYGHKSMESMERVDQETIFEAASLSKSFLLLVVYKLVDEGKLDLDKPLYQYLKHERLEYDPRYKLITGRMILSHSSGIENWQANHMSDTLEILSDPGKEYIYSGEGYNYLASVVEVILGESVEVYMQKRVYDPLMLKRTYSNFNEDGTFPVNYANGHNEFGGVIEKWKNKEPVPSSGIVTTARDYAQLIVSLFNGKHLSAGRVKDILTPAVRLEDDDPNLYHGAGFEILFHGKDTLIFQGGNNDGYKGRFCYSVTRKTGVVLLSNGDRGQRIVQKIADVAAGLDLALYFEDNFFLQYPSISCELFNVYRNENSDAMFKRLSEVIREQGHNLHKQALMDLAYSFRIKKQEVAKRILNENIKLFPEEPYAYFMMGKICYGQKDYRLALENLMKARDRNFDNRHLVNHDIKRLKAILSDLPK